MSSGCFSCCNVLCLCPVNLMLTRDTNLGWSCLDSATAGAAERKTKSRSHSLAVCRSASWANHSSDYCLVLFWTTRFFPLTPVQCVTANRTSVNLGSRCLGSSQLKDSQIWIRVKVTILFLQIQAQATERQRKSTKKPSPSWILENKQSEEVKRADREYEGFGQVRKLREMRCQVK